MTLPAEAPPIRLRLDGHGGLVEALTPITARLLFERLCRFAKLTRHERSLFHFDPDEEPPLPQQLAFRRGDDGALPPIRPANLRRMEGLVSARLLSGAWRLWPDEGLLLRGTLAGRRPGTLRRCAYVPLYGMIFEVEPLRPEALYSGPPRDVLAQALHPPFALLRFEGVVLGGEGLALSLRDRARLDHAWTQPLDGRGEGRVLRWFAVRSVHPQPGFSLVAPSLLGPRAPWARDTQP